MEGDAFKESRDPQRRKLRESSFAQDEQQITAVAAKDYRQRTCVRRSEATHFLFTVYGKRRQKTPATRASDRCGHRSRRKTRFCISAGQRTVTIYWLITAVVSFRLGTSRGVHACGLDHFELNFANRTIVQSCLHTEFLRGGGIGPAPYCPRHRREQWLPADEVKDAADAHAEINDDGDE